MRTKTTTKNINNYKIKILVTEETKKDFNNFCLFFLFFFLFFCCFVLFFFYRKIETAQISLRLCILERDVAQSIACPPLKRSVVGSILLSGPSCSLGYFPFQPVVHNWFIKGRGMYCSVYGKVHIKDPLLLIEKSSLCGGSGFPSKKCVNVTI